MFPRFKCYLSCRSRRICCKQNQLNRGSGTDYMQHLYLHSAVVTGDDGRTSKTTLSENNRHHRVENVRPCIRRWMLANSTHLQIYNLSVWEWRFSHTEDNRAKVKIVIFVAKHNHLWRSYCYFCAIMWCKRKRNEERWTMMRGDERDRLPTFCIIVSDMLILEIWYY